MLLVGLPRGSLPLLPNPTETLALGPGGLGGEEGGGVNSGIGGYSMASLAQRRSTKEAYGSALRAGYPRPPACAEPFCSSGSFAAMFTHDMHAFTSSIEGLQLHVGCAFAQGTAQHEALCMQVMLNLLLMLIIMITEELSCRIRQDA